MKQKFNITGMTCSACSMHVEKSVKKLNGVKEVNVNLLLNNMTAEYNPEKISENEIINAINNAGYGAYTEAKNQKKSDDDRDIKSTKIRLIVSVIFLIPLMYLAMSHMIYEWLSIPTPTLITKYFHEVENAITFSFMQLLLLLPIIYVNKTYYISGFKALIKKAPNMDSLIAIGSGAAIIYGIVAIFRIGYGLGHSDINIINTYLEDIYFESAGTILTLITFGKYLETKSKGKTSKAIEKLINLVPDTALVIRNNIEIQLKIKDILINDIVVVKPGGSVPVDGKIIEGTGIIDQSAITGESIPVEKNIGDSVIAGTINTSGYIKFSAEKVGENTTLSQIIKLVENASNSKAPVSKLADKISGIFVPIVILIAVISSVIWVLLGQSVEFALSIGIAVLVISCPCALGLATPVAIMVGTGKGAEHGVLFKNAISLENLHKIDTIVFDKTGTITEGKPRVRDMVLLDDSITENELLKIVASLEVKSEHPLAEAIIYKAKEQNIELNDVEEFISISGKGIKGIINGKNYYAGNINFIQEKNINISIIDFKNEIYEKDGKTIIYLANDNKVLGFLALRDMIKKDSKLAIDELKKMNINSIMLTGDNRYVAESTGEQVGIKHIIYEVLPQEKEKVISDLKKEGRNVAMCGDGINDSPALATADVGIAIGNGTDIAIESADVILMNSNILDVVTSIRLSKNVIRNIKVNLFWAFFYNVIGIPLAAGVFYVWLGWKLNPMFGAAAMSLSSTFVVLNALRIRRFKANNQEELNVSSKIRNKEYNMKKTIYVNGMQCMHCKKSVEDAVKNIGGVKNATVDLEKKCVYIELDNEINLDIIKKAIEEKGYEVISMI